MSTNLQDLIVLNPVLYLAFRG